MNWRFWEKKSDNPGVKLVKTVVLPSGIAGQMTVAVAQDPALKSEIKVVEVIVPVGCDCRPLGTSPCETCCACCAFFLVSLFETEVNDIAGPMVPIHMTLPSGELKRFMKGTETGQPRCISLVGKVGSRVN